MKFYSSVLLGAFLCVAGAVATRADEAQTPPAVLVCRAHQCANASYSMGRGFLFNKITQMMEANIGKSVLVCEADPVSHVCLENGIRIPAQTAAGSVPLYVDGLTLVNTKLISGTPALDLVWDYRVRAGNLYPKCQLTLSQLSVNFTDRVEMITNDFTCDMTTTGQTALNATYNIDYLDFDYGFIGAHYTIGIGQAVQGDKTGYMLMRFTAPTVSTPTTSVPTSVVSQPQQASPAKPAPLPSILAETAAAVAPAVPSPDRAKRLPENNAPTTRQSVEQPAPTAAETDTRPAKTPAPTATATDTRPAKTTAPATLIPIGVKTTITEKTVITPDASLSGVEPPAVRTLY